MNFEIKKRNIFCCGKSVIGDNSDYIANFIFDSEWDYKIKTARFQRTNGEYADVILENDSCEIPVEVLKFGYLSVGVFTDEMTTTYCDIFVKASIKEKNGNPIEPTPDVYSQIIEMLEDLQVNGVTDAQIEKAVKEYLEENPITGVDKEEVQKIVSEYIEANKDSLKGADGKDGVNGTDGKDGKSAYEIALANGFEGTEEEWLASLKGKDGTNGGAEISDEQIAEAVNAYMEENPVDVDVDGLFDFATYESDNVLNLADVAEITKNGVTMTVVDEVITLNGTATSNAELNLLSNFLEDGTYTFAYEILDGEFSGTLKYGYQSATYVDLNESGVTKNITSHNRTKLWVKSGSVCDNFKIHVWAVSGSEFKEWKPYGGWTEKKLNDDVEISKLEQHIADLDVHLKKENIYTEEIADIADKVFKTTDNGAIVAVLLTDTHIRPDDEKSVKQYEEMVDNIAKLTEQIPCDGVIHLGDHVNTQWWWANRYTEDLVYQRYVHDYANMLRKANAPIYCIQGNHDGGFNPKDDETGTTGSEYSNHSIIYRNLGTVTDRGANRNTLNNVVTPYYYVDNQLTKTRMVFMTTNMENPSNDVKGFDYRTTVWLRDTLYNMGKDWNALILTHISSARFYTDLKNADKYIEIVNAFNEHRATVGLDSTLTADFSEHTGKIVAEICGHYHGDSVIYPNDENARLSCPCIEIDSGSCLVGGGVITSGNFYNENDTNERSYDDITQHLFDVMVYRPDLNKIYMYRFGAGSDREINI